MISLRPYMVDINGAEWIRPDGDIPDLPTYEMLYHAAPSTIDLGGGKISFSFLLARR